MYQTLLDFNREIGATFEGEGGSFIVASVWHEALRRTPLLDAKRDAVVKVATILFASYIPCTGFVTILWGALALQGVTSLTFVVGLPQGSLQDKCNYIASLAKQVQASVNTAVLKWEARNNNIPIAHPSTSIAAIHMHCSAGQAGPSCRFRLQAPARCPPLSSVSRRWGARSSQIRVGAQIWGGSPLRFL